MAEMRRAGRRDLQESAMFIDGFLAFTALAPGVPGSFGVISAEEVNRDRSV
jgi:hypothetical protein